MTYYVASTKFAILNAQVKSLGLWQQALKLRLLASDFQDLGMLI